MDRRDLHPSRMPFFIDILLMYEARSHPVCAQRASLLWAFHTCYRRPCVRLTHNAKYANARRKGIFSCSYNAFLPRRYNMTRCGRVIYRVRNLSRPRPGSFASVTGVTAATRNNKRYITSRIEKFELSRLFAKHEMEVWKYARTGKYSACIDPGN